MKPNEATIAELTPLLEALCEDRLTPAEAVRLEQLVLHSEEARWYYIAYMDLHGSLYWDAAGVGSAEALSSDDIPSFAVDLNSKESVAPVAPALQSARPVYGVRFDTLWKLTAAASVCLATIVVWSRFQPAPGPVDVANTTPHEQVDNNEPQPVQNKATGIPAVQRPHGPPIQIALGNQTQPSLPDTIRHEPVAVVPAPPEPKHEVLDSREVVAAGRMRKSVEVGKWPGFAHRPRRTMPNGSVEFPWICSAGSRLLTKRKRSCRTSGRASGRNASTRCWTTPGLLPELHDGILDQPAHRTSVRAASESSRPAEVPAHVVRRQSSLEPNRIRFGGSRRKQCRKRSDQLPDCALEQRRAAGHGCHLAQVISCASRSSATSVTTIRLASRLRRPTGNCTASSVRPHRSLARRSIRRPVELNTPTPNWSHRQPAGPRITKRSMESCESPFRPTTTSRSIPARKLTAAPCSAA